MKIHRINNRRKSPKNLLAGFLLAFMVLFGAAACNPGADGGEEGKEAEEGIAETEELGYDQNLVEETDNELVVNEATEDFERRDANDDGLFDETEFQDLVSNGGFFDQWDANKDKALSGDELNDGIYEVYDKDDDEIFSAEEFESWNTAWGGDYDYEAWDTNDDGALDSDEFRADIGEAGVYDNWDADNDGLYSEEEVYGGLYNTWDHDEDGYLASEEYENYYNHWRF